MTIAANTSLTFSSVAIREQLSDVIYNIAPLDTPFMSGCSKQTVDNTFFEWQTGTSNATWKLHPDFTICKLDIWN